MTDEPTEFCQRHMGGYIPVVRGVGLYACVHGEFNQPCPKCATGVALERLYAENPHMPVMAQEVTARDARIAELEAELARPRFMLNGKPISEDEAQAILDDAAKTAQEAARTMMELCARLAESEEIARIRSDHIAVLEAENADQSRRLANLENRATVKIVGHCTAPVAIPITDGPAPMPANALKHNV
jgi:hypothetical protein